MTFDDLDTCLVIYSQFLVADSKSEIILALNNDPEAQDCCEVKIITESAHGKRDLA